MSARTGLTRLLLLAILSVRDMLVSAGPIALIVIGVLVSAYWYLDPQPPKKVTLATGPAGSAYAEFGERYARALRTHGIEVQTIATEGPLANLQLLREGGASVGFVRGGAADPVADGEAGINSLGALFYEPLWIFYRSNALPQRGKKGAPSPAPAPAALPQLKGLRVNLDKPGSGVPQIIDKMLRANGMDPSALQLSALEPKAAVDALEAGTLDAVVLASAPESSLVGQLMRAPGIALMEPGQAEAYSRIFPFFSTVTLPRGVVDLAADVPPDDVQMLATTTSLLAREDTHPALRQLFAQAAQKIHSHAGWFNHARDFPNTRTSELPVSPEGDRAINGTPPFWQRYLPFWASNLLERMWLVIGGLIVLLLPLSKVVPPLYTFRVRQRVFRWYAQLRELEAKVDNNLGEHDTLLADLNALDQVVNGVTVPLSYTEELYALRSNIHGVRKRLLSKLPLNAA